MIMSGRKVHTVRKKWDAFKLHMTTGYRTSKMNVFKLAPLVRLQEIEIYCENFGIVVDGRTLSKEEEALFIYRDGFDDRSQFYEFFRKTYYMNPCYENGIFKGVLIHWTDLMY